MRDSPEIDIMKGDKETYIQMIKAKYKAKTEFLLIFHLFPDLFGTGSRHAHKLDN